MSARAFAFRQPRSPDYEPFASMNITPLIDVMLVLLVMMILSIPMMTHKVPLDCDTQEPAVLNQKNFHGHYGLRFRTLILNLGPWPPYSISIWAGSANTGNSGRGRWRSGAPPLHF